MIKIAIVDDDKNMLSIITNNIKKMPDARDNFALYTFSCPEKVLSQLERSTEYDIIISDVEMEGMQGMEFGEIIRKKYPDIFLIFLTAYPHYAVKSYIINAHQYILKEEMEKRLSEVLSDVQHQISARQKKYRNIIKGNEIYKISYSDILYIQKMKSAKYIQYTTMHGKFQERISLEKILEELSDKEFLMVERGFIVNIEHISSVKGRTIYLENGEELSISRGKYAEVREKLHTCWRKNI